MMLLALVLFACKGPCEPGSDPSLDIGYGWNAFTPAEDGQEVELVYGQQGGFHIELAVATTELDASDLVSASFSGKLDGQVVAEAQPWFSLECDPISNTQQAAGLRLIFWDLLPPDLDGQTIDVSGSVLDARGETASATKSFVVIDPL
ncbi:MAG: hypothetical protein R3F61_31435 [Myxococcota bacterium]